jgi:hypothetical protein
MTDEITGTEAAIESQEISGTLKQGVSFTLFFGTAPRAFIISLRGSISQESRVEIEVDQKVVALLNQHTPTTTAEGLTIRLRSLGAAAQSFAASVL